MEARALAVWDGVQSATGLSARLFVEGLDLEPAQVEQFFARLARAQVLGPSAPVVPDFIPPQAGVEEPSDLVPTLRGDLVITRSTTSKGTLEVKDPISGRSFTLYDFEVSIARMLDGKRSAAEVLSAANRLGIPVTLPTLKTFLQQLRAYQFIDLAAGGGDSTWPKRRQWSAEVRDLYQGALRLMRSGKFDEARSYVEAMVEADPSNEEATALRQRIDAESKGSFELRVPFETLHPPVSSAAVAPGPAPADPFESFGFHSQAPVSADLPAIPEAVASPLVEPPADVEVPPPVAAPPPVHPERGRGTPKRSRAVLLVGLIAVALIAAVLLRPVEGTAQFPCELQAQELAIPRAPRAGSLGPPLIASGTRVEKGAVLARMTLAADEVPEVVEARIKDLEVKLAASHPPGTAKDITRAKAAVKKANAAVIALNKKRKKTRAKQLAALETKLSEKQSLLDAAKKTLEGLQQPDQRAELKASLEQLTSKKVAAAVRSERSAIVAPEAGMFIAPERAPTTLADDDSYGRIIAPTLKAVTREPLVTESRSGVFTSPAGQIEVKAGKAEAQLKFVGAKGTLALPSERTPWVLSVLKK